MTDPARAPTPTGHRLAAHAWIGQGVAYLAILACTIAGAVTLYTALAYGHVPGDPGSTFDADPVGFVVKMSIATVTTLVLGTVSTFATVGWLHVWRRKRQARQRQP